MKNTVIEKIIKWRYLPILIGMLVVAVPRVISAFPSVWFGDSRIRVFAIDRMVRVSIFQRMDDFEARVLGNHVLKTEHGDIRLGHGSLVEVSYFRLGRILDSNFKNGNASHNLVVEGIAMPENIRIAFRVSKTALLALDWQEIIVSGIPFSVGNIELAPSLSYKGMVIGLQSTPEYVLLADSTQINFIQGGRRSLRMRYDEEVWELLTAYAPIAVKFPTERELAMYRSIRFKPDWGEFLEGELWSGRK